MLIMLGPLTGARGKNAVGLRHTAVTQKVCRNPPLFRRRERRPLPQTLTISIAAWRRLTRLSLLLCTLLALGCASTRETDLAERFKLVPQTAAGGKFQHQLFLNQRPGNILHVYIEGDGKAWLTPRHISRDPTPDNPIMLELLSLDPAPAIYLGRPCYYLTEDTQCSPIWWTYRRYAEEVVDSLNRVLDQLAQGYSGIVLFGHSGGGTLAMLLAGRRTDVRMVVTLAGNLDIHTWATLHGYTPLYGSLNPLEQVPLSRKIRQVHFIGDADSVIPAALLESALAPQTYYELRVVPDFDHTCCWPEIWPTVLTEVNSVAPP